MTSNPRAAQILREAEAWLARPDAADHDCYPAQLLKRSIEFLKAPPSSGPPAENPWDIRARILESEHGDVSLNLLPRTKRYANISFDRDGDIFLTKLDGQGEHPEVRQVQPSDLAAVLLELLE